MITKDTIIEEIIKLKPEVIEVFMGYGMGCIGCPSAQLERLQDACEIHGIDLEEILERINKVK